MAQRLNTWAIIIFSTVRQCPEDKLRYAEIVNPLRTGAHLKTHVHVADFLLLSDITLETIDTLYTIRSNLSIPDTLGPSKTVLIIEVSLFESVHNSRFDYSQLTLRMIFAFLEYTYKHIIRQRS